MHNRRVTFSVLACLMVGWKEVLSGELIVL